MVVGTGGFVGGCDSKTTHDSVFFPSPVIGGCDELAVVGVAAGWKRASLGVCRLVWTRIMSSVCSKIQRESVGGFFGGKLDVFSSFLSFSVKLTVVGWVSSAVVVVEYSTGSTIAIEGVDKGVTAIFGKISLVE